MIPNADSGNGSPRVPVGEALLEVLRHPFYYFVRHWNWKSALFGAINRGTIFFIATMKRGRMEMSVAVLVEILFTCATAGIYAAFTQAMRFAQPGWLAACIVACRHSVSLVWRRLFCAFVDRYAQCSPGGRRRHRAYR